MTEPEPGLNPNPNIPLLRKAVEWAEAEHARPGGGAWLQELWAVDIDSANYSIQWLSERNVSPACGTAYCIAGWVLNETMPGGFTQQTANNMRYVSIVSKAANELGLTFDQGTELFADENSIETVRKSAEKFAGEEL